MKPVLSHLILEENCYIIRIFIIPSIKINGFFFSTKINKIRNEWKVYAMPKKCQQTSSSSQSSFFLSLLEKKNPIRPKFRIWKKNLAMRFPHKLIFNTKKKENFEDSQKRVHVKSKQKKKIDGDSITFFLAKQIDEVIIIHKWSINTNILFFFCLNKLWINYHIFFLL